MGLREGVALPESHRAPALSSGEGATWAEYTALKGHNALLCWFCCILGWGHGKAQRTGRGRVGEGARGTGGPPSRRDAESTDCCPGLRCLSPSGSVLLQWWGRGEWNPRPALQELPVPWGRGCCFLSAWSTPPFQQPLPNPGCFSRLSSNSDSSLNPSSPSA